MRRTAAIAALSTITLSFSVPAVAQDGTDSDGAAGFGRLFARCITLAGLGAGMDDPICDALSLALAGGSNPLGGGKPKASELPPLSNPLGGGSVSIPEPEPTPPVD